MFRGCIDKKFCNERSLLRNVSYFECCNRQMCNDQILGNSSKQNVSLKYLINFLIIFLIIN